ncbi:PE family protein [Mycobacterium parmense]|uniref:Uncharacterized protein n=1 Tax=Mycobacterium parmense TaxID=185642 RepID=A0A7I7YTQ8_9MYCO|nr:PE family protein [Mycobacterium parmense]ORW53224.1 hypothetical protein AWC20_20645 [Mycobacterium parmense]BBZ44383.1 hypothetical protein MPRM_16640 [Mycobacterium parmense]
MSFVVATPDAVQAAAEKLAGIRSALVEASASAGVPTTGVVAAAQDEVSASVAAMFDTFGQEYQAISAQATAFHEQFVNLISSGAAAYLGTEIANAEQNALNAGGGSLATLNGLLGQPGGTAGALASSLHTAQSSILPIGAAPLGSLLSGLGSSVGQSVNHAGAMVTALEGGGAASLLSGQVQAALQPLSGNLVGLSGALRSLEAAFAPGLLQAGAANGLAAVEGPYQALFANTVANLQTLGTTWAANPAPFLHQLVTNEVGYAQTVAAGVEYLLQNFPTVLANLPANISAAFQSLLAFDPAPYVEQFIDNQIAYAQIISMSLQNAAHDFGIGLQALPAAFQSAFQALAAGNVGGAISDIVQGFGSLFVTGFAVTTVGTTVSVSVTGTIGDLLPILAIPGQMAQNFTNLLPAGSIAAQMSQNFTNILDTVTDTSITAVPVIGITILPPSFSVSLTNTLGLPMALVFDAAGAPINGLNAFNATGEAFVGAAEAGNGFGAAAALIDAPAVVANGFLNGQTTVPLSFNLAGFPSTINLPLNGLLVPTTPYTAAVTLGPPFGTVTVPAGGTPLSGLAQGLLNYLPEQLALAITPS